MWGDRDEGFFVATEFMVLRINNPLRNQALAFRGFIDTTGQLRGDVTSPLITVTDGTTGAFINRFFTQPEKPGTFVGSHEVALDQHSVGGGDFTPGMRLTVGWRFRDGVTAEFAYTQMDTVKHTASAGVLPANQSQLNNLADSFISSPFFNFSAQLAGPDNDVISNLVPVPVPPGATTVAVTNTPAPGQVFVSLDALAALNALKGLPLPAFGIWNGAEEMFLTFSQMYSSAELNFRFPVYQDDYYRSYAICGLRNIHMQEKLSFRSVDQDIFGQELPQWSATYINKVDNTLWGLQCGGGNELYIGKGWAVSVEGRLGIFGDDVQEAVQVERGDLEFSISHRRTDTTVVPMFQAAGYLWWYPVEGVQLRAGYEVMGLIGMMRSPHPVDFNMGTLQPEFKRQLLWLDGFNVGISFIF
jgi:hypothetical protein